MTAKKLLKIDESSLPKNWKGATLADVTEYIQRGKGPKYIERSDLPVINQKCIRWFGIQKEHLKYVDPEQWSAWGEERYVRVGDVLWNSTGTGTIGRAAIVKNLSPGEKYVVDSHVTIVRPRGIDQQYVHYWIMSPSVQGSIEAMQSGSTNQVELSKSAVEALPIPVAPLEQQKRIVAEIEKQFSRLDEAVANLKRVKANLKRYKASVLKAAAEGKLTEDWRKQHPDVEPATKLLERILAERRSKWSGRGKYKEPEAPKTSGLRSLSDGWTWASPEQVSSADAYSFAIGPFGSNLKVSDYEDSGVPLIFVRNIRALNFGGKGRVYVSNAKAGELKAHRVSGGDILVTKMGDPPGDACLYPDNAPDAIITADCIKLHLSRLLPQRRFIAHAINSEIVKGQILGITKGVAQMKVSLARFRGIAIPLPPIAEQEQIVAEVEHRLSVIEELEASVEANLTRADRLRQSILGKAFSGRLDS